MGFQLTLVQVVAHMWQTRDSQRQKLILQYQNQALTGALRSHFTPSPYNPPLAVELSALLKGIFFLIIMPAEKKQPTTI